MECLEGGDMRSTLPYIMYLEVSHDSERTVNGIRNKDLSNKINKGDRI